MLVVPKSRAEAAEAERDALQAALGQIADRRRDNPPPGYQMTPLVAAEMARVARAALTAVRHPEGEEGQ